MPAIFQRRPWLMVAAVAATLCLGACSSFSDRTRSALSAVTPYKVEVVQGNFVSKEQVAALKPGMSRQQVREILGTSLLTDVFHANRWDYVFTIRRQGVDPQERHLTVFFNGEIMDRFEGDEMPSEEDFVATLDTRKKSGKVPTLEASEDDLKKFAPSKDDKKAGTADKADAQASLPPLPAAYPPLEAAR
ncbi:outer membrane protein assembly factor BamE [Variovorax sp. J22G73]|uniref:outer membrane protein assembly factor BamE n=1 Tax=unclassified Variovorax TaxID=663243 RepID=UPI000D5E53B8|nr:MULTISPECIES: outer membrane protein assembly factor BamE [unclassified Variovorax]MDM0007744.1 outer membrane protein assembly factor BamE [Variovorax sp. J22R203]MDM0099896.1 outer membrane protein assembly factor BamE [Variovorax sp. J22G73]